MQNQNKYGALRPKTRKVFQKIVARRHTEIVPKKGDFKPIVEITTAHVHNEGLVELPVRYLHNRAICAISGQVIHKLRSNTLEAMA